MGNEYRSVVDYEKLMIILSNAPELYEKGYLIQHDPINNYQEIKDRQSCLTIVYEFGKTFDEYGQSVVSYKPKSYLPDGRLWAEIPSVQGISRQIRHTICQQTMVDLDIKNAHPTILIRLCAEHNIYHAHLTRYINDREKVLEECVSRGVATNREDAKRLMLKVINGGGSYNMNKYPWMVGFANEMSHIRKVLIDEHYPQYYEIAKKQKGKNYRNLYGSALNFMLCVKERELLEKMIYFCEKNKLEIGALCQDGLMLVRQEGIDYEEYARQMTGACGIEIVVKEMDEIIPLDNMVIKDTNLVLDTIEPEVMRLFERAENTTAYTMHRIYIKMNPSVIDNFKYLRDKEKKYCSWFEKKSDGRWFQSQDPIFLSKDIAKCFSFYCDEKIKTLKNQFKEKEEETNEEIRQVLLECQEEMRRLKSSGYTDKEEKKLVRDHEKRLKKVKADVEMTLKKYRAMIDGYNSQKEYFQKGGFRRDVITELETEVLDYDILKKLDTNKKLLGFSNGVYDFEKMCFRPIQSNDYIQKSTGYEFPTKPDPLRMKFVEDTFKSMFIRKYAIRLTDPTYDEEDDPQQVENYECLMDTIASTLVGGNDLQRFYIWTGEGSNGKSVTQNAIKHTVGDYYCTIDVSSITNSKKSNNATSDFPKTKGCRQLFTSEGETTQVIQQALVKRATGKEDICEREVHQKSETFTPQFVLFLLMNGMPQINMDEAMKRRLHRIEFYFRFFSSKEDEGFRECEYNKTHFLGKDYQLEEKLQDCKQEMMILLIERYKDIQKRGMTISKQFNQGTKDYMNDQDALRNFILEYYVRGENEEEKIQHKTILERYNDSVPVFKRITKDVLTKKMKDMNIQSKKVHSAVYYFLRPRREEEAPMDFSGEEREASR